MPITFRHDAAAVVLPSTNEAGTKYGQSLVLQQQQQKYNAQQAGYERMFTLGRDQQQQMQEAMRQGQQNAANTIRDVNQNVFQQQRDKMLFDQQQQQQRAADFNAARGRIDTHARDMLANGQVKDPATRQKIQNLIAGKTIVMGSGYNETQQQNYLDQYNAELAKILSEIPEPPALPTAQDQFNQGIVTDPETGQRYRQNAKGDYEPIQQQPTRPTSADEAFMADPKLRDKYMVEAKEMVTERDEFGKPKPLDPATRKKAAEMAKKLYEEDNNLGTPTTAPALPGSAAPSADWSGGMLGSAPAAPTVPGEQRSILERPADVGPTPRTSPAPTWTGEDEAKWQEYQRQLAERGQSSLTVNSPDAGMPPSPAPPTTSAEASAYAADMTGKGYTLVTPADGGRPYYYKDTTATPAPAPASPAAKPPMPLTSNASSQNTQAANPWAEVASGQPTAPAPQSPVAPAPAPQAAQPAPTNTAPPAAPDFGAMAASAKSAKDKGYINQMAKVYEGQTPEVQSAISVFVNPSSTDAEFIAARDYLKAAGINLEQMANAPSKKQEPGAELRSPPRGPKY